MNTSPAYETSMAKEVRKELMQEYGGRLLPASHPITRHVTRVVERILQANHLGSLTHTTPSSTPSRPPSSWDADPWSSGSSNEDKYAPGTSAGSEQREWNLMVVDDPKMANAMASFGNIVVFTGILPIAKDEGGLASVLAHGEPI
jgi:predicted Zn-dependent protease